jgi:hypothetical protein
MSLTPHTRKPIQALTLADLAEFPIWEYADDEEGLEGRDETWVRPLAARAVPRKSYTIVAADFRAASGREYKGSITVSRVEDPAEIFNGVLHEGDGSYLVPNPELVSFDRAMADLFSGLGLSESETFPITYTLRVPFDSEWECRSGVLDVRRVNTVRSKRPDEEQMSFW